MLAVGLPTCIFGAVLILGVVRPHPCALPMHAHAHAAACTTTRPCADSYVPRQAPPPATPRRRHAPVQARPRLGPAGVLCFSQLLMVLAAALLCALPWGEGPVLVRCTAASDPAPASTPTPKPQPKPQPQPQPQP